MLNDIYQALDPVAFSLGAVHVRWYGLAYLAGFVCAALVMLFTARRWKLRLSGDDLMVVVLGTAVGVIFGARLFYVAFYNLPYYLANPSHILMFQEGGMSFHGGLLGGMLGGCVACRVLRLSFVTLADLAVIGAPLGLFFGRLANFVNGELWGRPTDLPWGVAFESGGGIMRHPSQLYEAVLEGLVIFIVLLALSRRVPPRPRGTFVGTFLVLYSVMRFVVEFVRVPDEQLGYLFGPVTMGQLLSLPLLVAGVCVLLVARRRRTPQSLVPSRGR